MKLLSIRRIMSCLLAASMVVTVSSSDSLVKASGSSLVKESEGKETMPDALGNVIVCLGEEPYDDGNDTVIHDEEGQYTGYAGSYLNSGAVSVNNVQGEFNETSAQFGKAIDIQMNNFLNDSPSGKKAAVADVSEGKGIKSRITFDLSDYSFYFEDDSEIMLWIYDALCVYPSLAALHTDIKYSYRNDGTGNCLVKMLVACTESSDNIKARTSDYINELKKLVNVPANDDSMSDEEKILYVHDRLINTGDYVDTGTVTCHTAAGILLDSKGVCQSYANVFNHALVMLGIDSIIVCSSTHSWNAVRLGGRWYYVDATWDDPVGTGKRSYTDHKYMFVKASDFKDSHTLKDMYSRNYGVIENNFGNTYDSFFPKANNITAGMWYSGGNWYYEYRGNVYVWDGESQMSSKVEDISNNSKMCVVCLDGNIYYSTSSGIYKYSNGISELQKNASITEMYLEREAIKYVSNGTVCEYVPLVVSPTAAPAMTAPPMATPEAVWPPTEKPNPTATPAVVAWPTEKPNPTATPAVVAWPTEKPNPTATPEAVWPPTEKPNPMATPEAVWPPTEKPNPTATPEAVWPPTEKPNPTATPVPTGMSTATPTPTGGSTATPTPTGCSTATPLPTATARPSYNTAVNTGNMMFGTTLTGTNSLTQTNDSANTNNVAPEGKFTLNSVKYKRNTRKITGKLSAKAVSVIIKVGNNSWKQAKLSGKKFTLTLSKKLKKKTKITIKVIGDGKIMMSKKYVVK